jgi:hypothetical protein
LLVGGGILFLGCDQVQGLLGIGGEEGGNNEVPDVPVAFRTYYVAASGNDTNGGTSEAPLQTIEAVLEKLAAGYTQEDRLEEEAGEIIIRGEVTASGTILIEGPGYPSIVLRGESGSGSTLTWSGEANTDYLLKITKGARITLDEDLTLTRTTRNGAMVYIGTDGAFTMNGGDIAGDSLIKGRGVYVDDGGAFTMNGGTISGNSASGNPAFNGGGGVYVCNGTFTMSGGTISGNTADYYGGGVCVGGDGAFTMNEGEGTISGNTADSGGGVYVLGGAFTMSGGTISDNTADLDGGGVCVGGGGAFTMDEGTISGNSASGGSVLNGGGGVYVLKGTFTMSGGTISDNKAGYGGGVYVYTLGKFLKNLGCIIYGVDGDTNTKNTANNKGHAVFVKYVDISDQKCDNTAGVNVLLDSGIASAYGGWDK